MSGPRTKLETELIKRYVQPARDTSAIVARRRAASRNPNPNAQQEAIDEINRAHYISSKNPAEEYFRITRPDLYQRAVGEFFKRLKDNK